MQQQVQVTLRHVAPRGLARFRVADEQHGLGVKVTLAESGFGRNGALPHGRHLLLQEQRGACPVDRVVQNDLVAAPPCCARCLGLLVI